MGTILITEFMDERAVAQLAERRPDLAGPACQSSVRLGLPADFLYRSAAVQKRLLAARDARLPEAA